MSQRFLAPTPTYTSESWWPGAPQQDFTKLCRSRFGDFVILDDVTDREVQILLERGHVLQGLAGLRAGTSNSAVRRAVTL